MHTDRSDEPSPPPPTLRQRTAASTLDVAAGPAGDLVEGVRAELVHDALVTAEQFIRLAKASERGETRIAHLEAAVAALTAAARVVERNQVHRAVGSPPDRTW